jgi:16S rRNA (cytosine1407-C5)-methyltransferase
MCAAPGGKTTDISSRLDENDLLIANEVISHRNNILFENVCKWGDGNTVISRTDAKVFKQHPNLFDVVFCDAPCSGEGMFRKDPTAIKEWSLENVELCSKRQQRIFFDTWHSLKPGGFFVYSTCTFNTKENEENVSMFCKETGGSLIEFEHPFIENLFSLQEKTYRCLPHKSKGEGLFFAIIQKPKKLLLKLKNTNTPLLKYIFLLTTRVLQLLKTTKRRFTSLKTPIHKPFFPFQGLCILEFP